MSKRCPYCGSCNTEQSLMNYAGRAVVNTGRFALAIGAGLLGSVFGGSHGHHIAHQTWEKTNPGEFKGYHCYNCNKDFSA